MNITVDINLCCKDSCPFPAVQHSSVSVSSPLVQHFSLMVVISGSCSALGEIQQSQMLVCCRTVRDEIFFSLINLPQAKEFSFTYITNPLDTVLVHKQKKTYIQAKVQSGHGTHG